MVALTPADEMPTQPTSDAEKVHQVLTWMLEGNSEHLIREAIESTWPGEHAEPLIVKTLRSVAASAEQTRESAADWCIEAVKFLYKKQVEIGEYAGAMRAVAELAKLATRKRQAKDATGSEPAETFPRVLNVDARKQELAARIARHC